MSGRLGFVLLAGILTASAVGPAAAAPRDTTAVRLVSGLDLTEAGPDTALIAVTGSNLRVDLLFRITPGPGNYVAPAAAARDSGYHRVRKITAESPGATNVAVANYLSNNFWESYLGDNGDPGGLNDGFGTPGGHLPRGRWSSEVWNSARCDTAEVNLFPVSGRKIGTIAPNLFMTAYHENDSRGGVTRLGIQRNLCFLVDPKGDPADITCTGAPEWAVENQESSGFDGFITTAEGTPIIPKGLFTPGTRIEYLVRTTNLKTGEVRQGGEAKLTVPDGGSGTLERLDGDDSDRLLGMWRTTPPAAPASGRSRRSPAPARGR